MTAWLASLFADVIGYLTTSLTSWIETLLANYKNQETNAATGQTNLDAVNNAIAGGNPDAIDQADQNLIDGTTPPVP